MELRKTNKTSDDISKKKNDKYYMDQIIALLNQIKLVDYSDSDIPLIIIKYFSLKNFRPLTQNEIIKYISNPSLFPNFAKKVNLRNDIISALNNNNIFVSSKKKIKYELNLKKCLNYLSLYQDKNRNTNSDSNVIYSPIMTFPDTENNIVYFSSENNQLNMSFVLDEDNSENSDNSFTFGEQSQIKLNNKKNKSKTDNILNLKEENDINVSNNNDNDNDNDNDNNINTEELENMALEKSIPVFEFIFDENKLFNNLIKYSSEFYNIYKKLNTNETNIKKLDEYIKKINSIINDLNIKIEPFNKLSSSFNEEKNELFNANSVIKQQLKILEILVENDFFPKEIYENERNIYISYQNIFKNLFGKLKEDYNEIKKMEQKINNIIVNLKNLLNKMSDELFLKFNDNYRKFYNLIKDIDKSTSIPINVNMNETVKLFDSYITDFGKLFHEIEEKEKKKKSDK